MKKISIILINAVFIFFAQNIYGYDYNLLCKPCRDLESYHVVQTVVTGDGRKINFLQEWWQKDGLYRRELEVFGKNQDVTNSLIVGDQTYCYEKEYFNIGGFNSDTFSEFRAYSEWKICNKSEATPFFFDTIACSSDLNKEFETKFGDETVKRKDWCKNNLLQKSQIKHINDKGEIKTVTNIEIEYNKIFSPNLFNFPSQSNLLSGGVGLELAYNNGMIKVIGILKNSSAEESNIYQGDIIKRVDGKEVKNLSLKDVVNLIKGPINSSVKLEVLRDNVKLNFELLRNVIEYKNVIKNSKGINIYKSTIIESTTIDSTTIMESPMKK